MGKVGADRLRIWKTEIPEPFLKPFRGKLSRDRFVSLSRLHLEWMAAGSAGFISGSSRAENRYRLRQFTRGVSSEAADDPFRTPAGVLPAPQMSEPEPSIEIKRGDPI